jgi:signal transduction histidine kinase
MNATQTVDEAAPRHQWRRWVIGLLPVAATIAVRALLEPVLADKSPFLLFTLAVMAAAAYGGLWVGATTTLIGAVAGLFFLSDVSGGMNGLLRSGHWLQPLLYLLVCGGVTWMMQVLHRIRQRTEEYAAEQERLAARLEEASRAKDEFLATLSHELRTPLTAIIGWTDMLAMSKGREEELTHAVEVIRRNARSQSQLISDLLDLARITSGKIRVSPRTIDIAEAVAAAIETVRPAAVSKNIQMDVQLSPGFLVWADPDRLQQVFWNLLSNAVRHTPASGRIQVRLKATAGEATVTVTDTGPGLAADLIPHLFERFRQGDASSKRAKGGLGLGLAIVKDLVELQGGTVSARNRADVRGASFEVALPRIRPTANRGPADRVAEMPERSLQGVRVLVVDDEEDTRQVVAFILQAQGAQVVAASSVSEAMSALEAHAPDVVLTDLAMPEQDGFELLRQVKARASQAAAIPVAAVSAFASAEDRGRTREAGFRAHIGKPVDPGELELTVRRLVVR